MPDTQLTEAQRQQVANMVAGGASPLAVSKYLDTLGVPMTDPTYAAMVSQAGQGKVVQKTDGKWTPVMVTGTGETVIGQGNSGSYVATTPEAIARVTETMKQQGNLIIPVQEPTIPSPNIAVDDLAEAQRLRAEGNDLAAADYLESKGYSMEDIQTVMESERISGLPSYGQEGYEVLAGSRQAAVLQAQELVTGLIDKTSMNAGQSAGEQGADAGLVNLVNSGASIAEILDYLNKNPSAKAGSFASGVLDQINQQLYSASTLPLGKQQFDAYVKLGYYDKDDVPIIVNQVLSGVIPKEQFESLPEKYQSVFRKDGYQAMVDVIQKDALAVDKINQFGSVDNYIKESVNSGVSNAEIVDTLISAVGITQEQASSLVSINTYDTVENYIISSINSGISVDTIKGTLLSAGYLNVGDSVDSMAMFMSVLPTMPKDLQDGFTQGGIEGYKNALSNNYTLLPDEQYIPNEQLEKLKADSPDYYYKIATTMGMGKLISQMEYDTKLQTDSLKALEDKGYLINPQPSAVESAVLQATSDKNLAQFPQAPYVPQYDIKGFIEDNPNQESIQVLRDIYGSNSEVVKDAQNYVDYLNNIVGYLDKNVDDSTIPASYDLALGRAIDKAGLTVINDTSNNFGLNWGADQAEPARYTWADLTEQQKLDVAKYYMDDPYRDNLFSSLVAEYDYAYSKLPTAAKIALPIGVAVMGFIAAPLAIAGMALFTTDAVAHTIAPLTISNKTLTYQIDQNGKYFSSLQSAEGINSVVLGYLSQAINGITGEKVTDPIKAYNALSPEDKAKVDAEYTRKQLGLEPSAMQYVMAGGMIVASAIPLIGGAIKGITGTAGAIGRGVLVGTQVGLTGMFIGASIPTIINKDVKIEDKITAIAFDVMMLHGLGKMAGMDKALSSASGIAKSLITGKGLPARALSVSKGEIYRSRVPEEFISEIDRIQKGIEGIRDTVYSDKLSVEQKMAAVKEVLSPEDFATVKKLVDYVDAIQKQKTVAADYDNFDFTIVKNANEKIGTANNELKTYFEKNGLGVYGSTVEYLFKGAVKGMKPADFDVRVFLDSGLKDRAKIASDLAGILKKNGVDAQAQGNAVKVNGEKIFDIHNWNEKFNTVSLMPFGWEQKGYVVKDGVRLVPIEEQAASRVKSIFDKASVEGTIGTKPGELGVLLPEQLKVSEAQRTYDTAKIVMRLNDLLAKSEAYFRDKGDLSKANDIKGIVDILSQKTTTEPIVSAEEQIGMQENEFGTVENYRAEVAKAQVEALKYWQKGNKGAYTHKTELGEITINPTPINEVMPNTLFSVTGEGTSFTKGLEFDGKVVSGKVIENKGAELTVPNTTPDGKPIEVMRRTYASGGDNIYYRGESSAPNAHIGNAFYYTNSLKGARMWGDKAVIASARKGTVSEIIIDGAIIEPKNPFTIDQGTLTNLASGKADIPSLGLYGKDMAKLGINRGSVEFNEIVAKAAKSKGYDALKILIDEKYAAEPGEHYIAVLDESIIKAPLSSLSKVDLSGAKIAFGKNGKPITNEEGLVGVDISENKISFTKPSEMQIDETVVKETNGVLTGDTANKNGEIISLVEPRKHSAIGGDIRRRVTAVVTDSNGRLLLTTDRKDPKGYYDLVGGEMELARTKSKVTGDAYFDIEKAANLQLHSEVDIEMGNVERMPAYLGQMNRHSLQGSYVVLGKAKSDAIDIYAYNRRDPAWAATHPPELRDAMWWDGKTEANVSPATYDIIVKLVETGKIKNVDLSKLNISKQTPSELLTARDTDYYRPNDLGVGGVEKNFDIYYKGDGKAYVSAEDAAILLREVSGGLDAGKWITNKYEAVDKQIPIFTSDELAYNYLVAKYGGKENIPNDAAVIAIKIDAKTDLRGANPTDTDAVNALEGGLIDPVQKIQYDFTTDGAKPVVENELTVKVGGELLKVPKTELSDKYGIDTGVTETKDINTGKTYKVLWLATENAIKAGYGYTPTASQVRTASFLALKGMISDILHPHKPSDIIFTDETVATRGTLFDLFHVDKMKFKADDGAFKNAKEIRDAVIKEDNAWLEKATQVIKDKIKLLHEDEAGFIKLYGKEEATKLKEVVESSKPSDYVDYVRAEKDKLQAKEIEDKLNQNKEIKDYLDKVSADTKANLLTVNLAELTRPFMINTGNALADVQESSNLYNLDTIGAYGEKNTSPLSVAPVVSEDKIVKPKTEVKPDTKVSGISPIEKELDISKPSDVVDIKPSDSLEFSPLELPDLTSPLDMEDIEPFDFSEISPLEPTTIEPIEPSDITPIETTPIEPLAPTEITPIEPTEPTTIEPMETTPIEPTETTPVEPTETTPVEPTDITPIETPEVTEVEETEIVEPPEPPETPRPPRPVYAELPPEALDNKGKIKPGTLTWRQGSPQGFPMGLWKLVPPPYKEIYTLRSAPPGTYKFATGKGSAYKTIQALGKPPEDANVNLGWADIHISSKTGKLDIEFRPNEEANVGTREETIGMGEGQIPYEGVEKDRLKSKLDKDQKEFLKENPQFDVEDLVPVRPLDYDREAIGERPEEIPQRIYERIPRERTAKSEPPRDLQKVEMPQYKAGRNKVYLVNKDYVNNFIVAELPDADEFKTGATWLQNDYIPRNEIWIDNKLDGLSRKEAVLEELKELRDVAKEDEFVMAKPKYSHVEIDEMIDEELNYYSVPTSERKKRASELKPRKSRVRVLEEEYKQYDVPRSAPKFSGISTEIAPQYYLGHLIEPKIQADKV